MDKEKRNERYEEFEQMLEDDDFYRATVKFYKTHARSIIVAIMSIGVIGVITMADLSVGKRLATVLAIVTLNYGYGKIKDD